jgi:hypothetical protein
VRSGLTVEQLFVRRVSGRVTFLAVLEAPSGARSRESVPTPFDAVDPAMRYLVRHYASRGDVDGAGRLRVREERAGALLERRDLAATFRNGLARERADGEAGA